MSAGELCHRPRRARRPPRRARRRRTGRRQSAGSLSGGSDLPPATVARLPVYLRELNLLSRTGVEVVSSGALAEAVGVGRPSSARTSPHLGSYGTRGVGYDVALLQAQLGREMGSAHEWPVVVVGIGNLGRALAGYSGFSSRGFRIVALVDPNPDLIGPRDQRDRDHRPRGPGGGRRSHQGGDRRAGHARRGSASGAADRLVHQGVTSILNFAASVLTVPDRVTVRKVDLGQELQILAYHELRKSRRTRPRRARWPTPHWSVAQEGTH